MTYAQAAALAEQLGATPFTAGVMVSLVVPTMFLVDLFGARYVPRIEGRSCIVVSQAIYGLGNLVVAAAPNLAVMACGRLLEGVGCAMFMTGGVQLVARLSPSHSRGRAIGAFNAAWFAGIGVGPPLGGWLTDVGSGHLGTRLAFYGCAVLSLFTAVAVRMTMSTYPSPLRPQIAVPRLRGLGGRRLWAAVMLGGLGEAIRDGTQMVLIPMAALNIGMSTLGAGMSLAALAITDVLFMRYGGRATDRFGRAPVLLLASLTGVAVLAIAPGAHGTVLFILLCAAMGPSQGAMWVIPPAMVSDLGRDREAALSAYRLATDLALAVGATSAGVLAADLGAQAGLRACALAFVMAILLTLAASDSHRAALVGGLHRFGPAGWLARRRPPEVPDPPLGPAPTDGVLPASGS
jgi:predicted MFS family arabinose efflux permease